ncbi:MAG: hypothetical protein WB948_13640, partial [Desulfobaccales bacterium]
MRIYVLGFMAFVLLAGARPALAEPAPPPPHPRILEATQAPRAARIISRVPLAYAPLMSEPQRRRDFLEKIELAKRLLGVRRLVEIRKETLAMVPPGMEVSWEYLRWRHWPDGDRVGVTLSAPVWVP